MKLIVVLGFLVAVAAASPFGTWRQVRSPMENPRYQKFLSALYRQQNAENDIFRGRRIVGGRLAASGQFPYQVYTYLDDTYLCGGSIISSNYVLTAAHCVYGITLAEVFVGNIDRYQYAPWELAVDSSGFTLHASYNDDSLINDIALIRTPGIPLNGETIGAVTLPARADANVNLQGMNAIVSGFGRFTDESDYTSSDLLYVEVPVMNNAQCAAVFGPAYVRDSNVCVDAYGGRGSCGGDSGGPLTAVVNGRRVQIGIVSFGAAAGCELGYPDVFTRVTSFLDWIGTNSDVVIA